MQMSASTSHRSALEICCAFGYPPTVRRRLRGFSYTYEIKSFTSMPAGLKMVPPASFTARNFDPRAQRISAAFAPTLPKPCRMNVLPAGVAPRSANHSWMQ